jgi:methyl-accepting chemotaxis protein
MKITKRQLRRIIKEEKSKLLSEDITDHEMYQSDDELRSLGEAIEKLVHWTVETNKRMDEMAMRYGELAANTTRARGVARGVEELADRFDQALDEMLKVY